jgi:predicted DNA-binding transcriptional regulator AlpA
MNSANDFTANFVLRVKDAAHFVGCSLSHFRRLYALGQLPAPIRIGERRLGWRIRDLDSWIEDRRITNVPHAPTTERGA